MSDLQALHAAPGSALRPLRRLSRILGLGAILAAVIAVWLIVRDGPESRVEILVVGALGAGLASLIGALCMAALFLVQRSRQRHEPPRRVTATGAAKDDE